MKKFAIIFLFLLSVLIGRAQISTTGTDFWLSYMQNYDDPENTQLYITSDVGATGVVSIPGTGWTQNFTIAPNGSVFVDVVAAQNAAIDVGNTVLNKAVHVTSNTPVAVYAANQRDASSDATLVMPVQTLGDSYFINAYSPFNNLPSQFVVVGVEDGTTIEIIPTAAVIGGSGAGVPFTITLNQGQVYLVQSMGDLTGTTVKATDIGNCNNFAVYAGNQCANVPLSCTYCDHLFEQMIPVKAWGKNYATVLLMTRSNDTYRILASENGTVVNINGGPNINLNAGQFYETTLSTASFIVGSEPISVAQYSQGTSCDGVTSDPFMIMLSPVEQTLDYIVFQAFNTAAINQFYTNIVTETTDTAAAQLDGAAITGWATIASNPAYSFVRKNLTQGTHVLTSPEGIIASVYGFGNVESYGYLAGANIQPLNVSFDIVIDGTPTSYDIFEDTLTCSQTTVDFQSTSTNITSIEWDFGDGSPIFVGNPALDHTFPSSGDYTVTMYFMRDGSCVQEHLEMPVHVSTNLPPITEIPDSVVCNGDPYTVNLNLTGVTYLWQDNSTNGFYTFSQTGDYSVTVTDAIGCSVSESCHIDFVNISVNISEQDVTCNGTTDGELTANPVGGNLPYQYVWSTAPTDITQTITNLGAGNYSVTVTENLGCTASNTGTISVPQPLIINVTNIQSLTCFGFDDGTATVNVVGGTTPYSIAWADPTIAGFVQDALAPGTYDFTITDDNGCFSSSSFVINDAAPFSVSSSVTNVACNGNSSGSIIVNVTGGTPPLAYNWSNSQMVSSLYNIVAGSYTISVTDYNGCSIENTFVVTEPELLETHIYSENVDCYGDNSGQVLASVTGGTWPYLFNWSNGSSSQNLTDVYFGNYIVTVTDANSCTSYGYAIITQPQLPLHGVIDGTDVRCFGEGDGVADLNVTGGTPPYYFEWNTGAISEDIENLIPGIYSVTITDELDCTHADTIQILQPYAPLSGIIMGTDARCNGYDDGSVYITISGGRTPYQFQWSNGSWQEDLVGVPAGDYSVTITDASLCHLVLNYNVNEPAPFYIQPMDDPTICYGMTIDIGVGIIEGSVLPYTITWSNSDFGMTTTVNPLETTVYTAHIVDAAFCVSEDVEITVYVHEPLQLSVTASEDTVCPGEEINCIAEISGGGLTGNYLYVNDSLVFSPVSLTIDRDTIFNFTITDVCGFAEISQDVSVYAYPRPLIDAVADKYSGCTPLTVSFSELSPHIGQRYIWNFDDGDFENLSFDKNPVHTFINWRTYHVGLEVISPDGCPADTTIGITVFPIPDAEFRADREAVSLGFPLVNFTNYTEGGFWYNWDFGDGSGSGDTNPQHSYTAPGVYTVVLSASSLYGCFDTASVNIQVNNELTLYAPTAFTPNYDELNDSFRVFAANIDPDNWSLSVYSRWGELIFLSEEYEEGWDGRYEDMECPPGVYSWYATFKDLFGNIYYESGYFTLIR